MKQRRCNPRSTCAGMRPAHMPGNQSPTAAEDVQHRAQQRQKRPCLRTQTPSFGVQHLRNVRREHTKRPQPHTTEHSEQEIPPNIGAELDTEAVPSALKDEVKEKLAAVEDDDA